MFLLKIAGFYKEFYELLFFLPFFLICRYFLTLPPIFDHPSIRKLHLETAFYQ